MTTTEKEVIDGLGKLINQYLNFAAHEQYSPSGDPDQMDNRIADGKGKAVKLRKIREDFEDVITGIIGD